MYRTANKELAALRYRCPNNRQLGYNNPRCIEHYGADYSVQDFDCLAI